MMDRKRSLFLSMLFFSLLLLQVAPVNAHAPASIDLDYDFGTQVLTVQVSHSVPDPNSHYIIQIVVEKNSVEFTTRDFTSQPSTSGITEMFDVSAVDGDVLRVTASCNFVGDLVDSITVSDPAATTTDTTTEPTTTPTNGDGFPISMPLLIAVVVVALGVVLVVVILLKRR
jgi:hypothetical protein